MMPLQNVRTTAVAADNMVFTHSGFTHTFPVWPCSLFGHVHWRWHQRHLCPLNGFVCGVVIETLRWIAHVKPIWQLILWSAILLISFFLSQDVCLWPAPRFLQYPTLLLLFAGGMAFFLLLAAVFLSVYFAIQACTNWRNPPAIFSALRCAAICILFTIGFFSVVLWNSARRTAAFTRAATNGTPIVTALRTYRTQHGAYPASLKQLVPDYVSAIPWTGLIGYPEFTYHNGHNDISVVPDSYELRIDCPSGGINFDRFIYWPSETYPKTIQGNGTEKIGPWVYVHE